MKTGESLKKNYISNLLLRIAQVVIPLITFPYLTRVLQPEILGKVTFAESLVYYLVLLTQLGTPVYGIRVCAAARDDKMLLSRTVQELMTVSLGMAMVSLGILAVIVKISPKLRGDYALFSIFSLEILANAVSINWMYEGLEQYSYIALRTIAVRVLSAGMVFLLVRRQEHYLIYAMILVLSTVLTHVINLIYAANYITFFPTGKCRPFRHLKSILVFFAMAGATAVYTSLDKVMLGFMAGNAAVGWYSVAVKIKYVLYLCVSSLAAVLLPRSSYYVEKGKYDEFRELSRKAFNYVLLVAVPLAVYFFLYAEETVRLLSGEAFLPAVLPMRIIMPSVVLIGFSNVLTVQVLIPLGKEKTVLCSNIAGAVVDCILNFILIPQYGTAGAALSTLIAEAGVLITLVKGAEDFAAFSGLQYWKTFTAVIIGSAASWPVHYLLREPFPALFVSSVLFFGVFGLVVYMLKEELVMNLICSLRKNLK